MFDFLLTLGCRGFSSLPLAALLGRFSWPWAWSFVACAFGTFQLGLALAVSCALLCLRGGLSIGLSAVFSMIGSVSGPLRGGGGTWGMAGANLGWGVLGTCGGALQFGTRGCLREAAGSGESCGLSGWARV